jgi:hypothetical protein
MTVHPTQSAPTNRPMSLRPMRCGGMYPRCQASPRERLRTNRSSRTVGLKYTTRSIWSSANIWSQAFIFMAGQQESQRTRHIATPSEAQFCRIPPLVRAGTHRLNLRPDERPGALPDETAQRDAIELGECRRRCQNWRDRHEHLRPVHIRRCCSNICERPTRRNCRQSYGSTTCLTSATTPSRNSSTATV